MFFDNEGTAPDSIAGLEDYPSIRIVRLRGPIDRSTVADIERFRKWVAKHKGFKLKHVLLDFKLVTQVDTSAVAEILQEVSELKTGNFRLGAVHLSETVRSLFDVLRVSDIIRVYPNESEAVDDLTRK